MVLGLWVLLACIAGVAAAMLWWKRRVRRVFTIDHVRVELHDAHIVDDRVIDAVWRGAISMTNRTRRPRALPMFGERATVTAGRRVYLAEVYLESDATEVNPGDLALAWVEFVLPGGARPLRGRLLQLRDTRRDRSLQFSPLGVRTKPAG